MVITKTTAMWGNTVTAAKTVDMETTATVEDMVATMATEVEMDMAMVETMAMAETMVAAMVAATEKEAMERATITRDIIRWTIDAELNKQFLLKTQFDLGSALIESL